MFYLKRNVPGFERAARAISGVAAAGLGGAHAQAPLGMWIGIAGGLTFAVTGLVGFCPMCAMAGRKAVGAGE